MGYCPECARDVKADEVEDGRHTGRCKGCIVQVYADEEAIAFAAADRRAAAAARAQDRRS